MKIITTISPAEFFVAVAMLQNWQHYTTEQKKKDYSLTFVNIKETKLFIMLKTVEL